MRRSKLNTQTSVALKCHISLLDEGVEELGLSAAASDEFLANASQISRVSRTVVETKTLGNDTAL